MRAKSGRVGARRRLHVGRQLLIMGLVAGGASITGMLLLDSATAGADPPSVACSVSGSTLDVVLSGQTTLTDTLDISAASGDYALWLGTSSNTVCTSGGPYALSAETGLALTSTETVPQYVTIDDTNGQLASSSAGCPSAISVSLDTPTTGSNTLVLLDDASPAAASDDTVAVSSSSSSGSTTEAINLSEGGCPTPDISVPATTSPPNLVVTGQAGSGDVLDLGAQTSSSASAITVNAGGDTGGTPGSVQGEPGGFAVAFAGIETVLGAGFNTDFQPGSASGLVFDGQAGQANTLDLSGEGSPAANLAINDTTGALTGTSSGGGSIVDSFSGMQSFVGSPTGTAFIAPGTGGLTFTGHGTGNSLDLNSAPADTSINATTGAASGLGAGVGSSTTDAFSAIQDFTGSGAGSTVFTALGSGGMTFTGQGAGNRLDLTAAPAGGVIDAATGVASGLSPGAGSSTTDAFSAIQDYTGSGAGSTAFDAPGSGGLTFDGQGAGNSLDLNAAPASGAINVVTGVASGLTPGVGTGTTDVFSGVQRFTASASGSTTFTAPSTGGFTFVGQGTGNALNLSAAPAAVAIDAATDVASGLAAGGTDSFSAIQHFTGSASGSTTFTAPGSGGLTFAGQGSGNSLNLSAAPANGAINAATGVASGLTAGIGTGTTDTFSGVQGFTGSASGSTTFTAPGTGGLAFTGQGLGNSLNLGAAPAAAAINVATGVTSGLGAGVGSSTTDSFSAIQHFTGSASGTTTFTALGSGGLSFTGQGAGNRLDLSAAPAAGVIDAATGVASGLTAGAGASTTDSFSAIQVFTGSGAGSTAFDAPGSGGLTFTGQGAGNSLDLNAAPASGAIDVVTGIASGLTPGVGTGTTDAFSGVQSFTASASGSTTFTAPSTGGLTFVGQGTGNSLNLGAAPAAARVTTNGDSLGSPGTVTGLNVGVPTSTTDTFSDVSTFTGPLPPSEPTSPVATPLDAKASVAFHAPATNLGSPITSYTVTATDLTNAAGDQQGSGSSIPVVVTGLTDGDSYDFTVRATNVNGTGPASSVSGAVTPKAVQAVRFTTSTPDLIRVAGKSYVPAATASSGLPVTITLDAKSTGCVLTNGTVHYPAAGICLIDASQAGNGVYDAAPTVHQRILVLKGINAITITTTPPPHAVVFQTYRPAATATSHSAVTIRIAPHTTACILKNGVVTFVAGGICTVDFRDSATATYLSAPERYQRFSVARRTVTVRASASPRAALSSRSITLKAVVSSVLAHGAVRFSVGGVGLCAATIHNRVAQCQVGKVLAKGSYQVTASYSGSPSFKPAMSATNLRVA